MRRPYPWNKCWEHLYTATEKIIWDYTNDPTINLEVRQQRVQKLDRELARVISRLPPGKNAEERVRKFLKQTQRGSCYVPWLPGGLPKPHVAFWEIHPRAIPLIDKYGVWQKPYIWKKQIPFGYPENNGEPQLGKCYEDAELFMTIKALLKKETISAENIGYSEGIVLGACTPAMLHAWNWDDQKPEIAIDWNQYASSTWNLYFGLSFTPKEYRKIMNIQHGPKKSGSIFHRRWFTRRAENFIRDLLEERKRKQRQQEQEVCKEAAD